MNQTPVDVLNQYFLSLYPLIFDAIIKFIAALFIFVIGWLIALLVKLVIEFILKNIKLEELFKKLNIDKYLQDFNWEERLDKIVAEIFFWIVFVVFLMVSFDIIGLQVVNDFIRGIFSYLPRAVSGGLILAAGFLFGELVRKALVGILRGLDKRSSQMASSFIKWAIVIFALITALNQWGIAPDIMNILVFGMVLFLALAGGLSFGLGGQETAREILESLKKKLS